jgi:hypothetical protein
MPNYVDFWGKSVRSADISSVSVTSTWRGIIAKLLFFVFAIHYYFIDGFSRSYWVTMMNFLIVIVALSWAWYLWGKRITLLLSNGKKIKSPAVKDDEIDAKLNDLKLEISKTI